MDDQWQIRLDKLKKIQELGVEIYPYQYDRSHTFGELITRFGETPEEELEKLDERFRIAGRIVAVRVMGKSAFMHLYDGVHRLQIYIRKDVVSERDFELYKLLDIGDQIGAAGKMFRTRSGELTLLADSLTFLVKSLHPLPEKWHGLQDKELRYRQRHLDLIVNEDTRRIFYLRSQIIRRVRMFFYERGYHEVETPMMHAIPGGASARPFVTHHNALDIDLYLRVAPELYLKRLLVGGMEKIFEINRNFRNEGVSLMHNPEFTMIEFYELYKDYNHYMELTEALFAELNREFIPSGNLEWHGKQINLHPPFERRSFMDAIAERAHVEMDLLWDENRLAQHIRQHLHNEEMPPTYGKMLEWMFDHYLEEALVQPTFITDYPKVISPLSKVSRRDPRLTERFELFVAGMEIANGFSELNDPIDQRARFEAQVADREKGDDEALWIDYNFLEALEYGMAPAAGEGIGIDRLVMLYTATPSIKEIILFPLLRPKE